VRVFGGFGVLGGNGFRFRPASAGPNSCLIRVIRGRVFQFLILPCLFLFHLFSPGCIFLHQSSPGGKMFKSTVYTSRRQTLAQKLETGIALFFSNDESPMNYPANTFHYRQDSTFLYYFGLKQSGLVAVIDADIDQEIIFGDELTLDDVIWMGSQKTLKIRCTETGISDVRPLADLSGYLQHVQSSGRTIHFLPPYREEHRRNLSQLLGLTSEFQKQYASEKLIEVIVEQRSVKTAEEIEQLRDAHEITRQMHLAAMQLIRPGLYEREISGTMEGIALTGGGMVSFPPIVSVNGQILHNHFHGNKMLSGELLVVDAGAENEFGYAADITRTLPVGGKFSSRQRDIYDIVLAAQNAAIGAARPGVFYKDVHLLAARVISEGLKNLGLISGSVDDAVEQGVHALFFPHGLGHMLGLDVHDMENLGEQYVGYTPEMERSGQFGLAYLRLARELREGFVLTVEPGIYFIPELIGKWQNENMFSAFINYEQVMKYDDFGGIRIEDDLIIRAAGAEILGQPIPKTAAEIEAACRK